MIGLCEEKKVASIYKAAVQNTSFQHDACSRHSKLFAILSKFTHKAYLISVSGNI